MSHFLRVAAAFKDADALCVALEAMGFQKDQIIRSDTPQKLYSVFGTSAEAEIVVRRREDNENLQLLKDNKTPRLRHGDMGFKLNTETNEYECVLEEYDKDYEGFDHNWMGQLKQEYAIALTNRTRRKPRRFIGSG